MAVEISAKQDTATTSPEFDVPVVVLCGGKGSRLAERTRDEVPKHLLSVDGRRIIDYVIEPFVAAPKLVLATSVHGGQIIDHFGRRPELPVAFSHQDEPEGVIPAILKAVDDAEIDATFAIAGGDEIVLGLDAAAMLSAHRRARVPASLAITSFISTKPDFVFTYDDTHMAQQLERDVDPAALQTPSYFGTGTFVLEQEALPVMAACSSWEQFVRTMIERQALLCHVTDHQFYNLNTPGELDSFSLSATSQNVA